MPFGGKKQKLPCIIAVNTVDFTWPTPGVLILETYFSLCLLAGGWGVLDSGHVVFSSCPGGIVQVEGYA